MRSKAIGRRKVRALGEEERIVNEGIATRERVSASLTDVIELKEGTCPWTREVVQETDEGEDEKEIKRCTRPAGMKTAHEGVGYCYVHGGNTKRENRIGALIMAHAIAGELDVTPWDALLTAVRRFAAMAAFYDSKLATVVDDAELEPGGDAYYWLNMSEKMHEKAARFGKMAIDGGVAERLVHQVELEGTRMVTALNAALEVLSLSQSDEDLVRATLATELRKYGTEVMQIEM